MQLSRPGGHLGDSEELEQHVAMLDLCTDLNGPDHPETFAAAKRLSIAFWSAGYTDQAIDLLDQVLDRSKTTLDAEHPLRVDLLCTLGEILLEQRHLESSCK